MYLYGIPVFWELYRILQHTKTQNQNMEQTIHDIIQQFEMINFKYNMQKMQGNIKCQFTNKI